MSKDNGGPASDRELLEMAAKAIGINTNIWHEIEHPRSSGRYGAFYCYDSYWNPLTDDGDALRLAVNLSISIDVNGMFVHADCRHRDDDIGYFEENTARYKGCIMESTRRAIVRAAAAIGSAM